MAVRFLLTKRNGGNEGSGAPITQNATDDDYYHVYPYDGDSWWWSSTGMAVRYTVITIIFTSILLFFLGGYVHAKSRMRKGLPLLAYHRWMVHRSVRHQYQYQYQQPGYNNPPYHHQHPGTADPYEPGYVMHGYPPPPPAYHRYGDAPPAYAAPPAGASKAMADQSYYNNSSSQQNPQARNEGEGSTTAVPR